MVDVSGKSRTLRVAAARGRISMGPGTLRQIEGNRISKGDVLAVARIAGIQAAKGASALIPLCHPIGLTNVELDFKIDRAKSAIEVSSRVVCRDRTGAEMEALTAVAAACLTVYDMAKAADRGMVISDIRLIEKRGGRSGRWVAPTLGPSPRGRGK
ncbi:MAG TPA: cyclic pyranopterin monophosphate synthase MoaC [candidate division Zixibacteria bacterium]|jgi:cyclic pyranopterin phosphate synthase|nr:cyclic pyranopterin monophosphate synthase MoaC [candidate division Zixibacteria bacterium]